MIEDGDCPKKDTEELERRRMQELALALCAAVCIGVCVLSPCVVVCV